MLLIINGETRDVDPVDTVAGLLNSLNLRPQMIVVEQNGDIVPRERYADRTVTSGDHLEIVQMMAGG